MENIQEIREIILSIPDEMVELKGNEKVLMMKPKESIGITINGIRYEDLKALQVLEDEVKIYHGKNMVEVVFKEVKDIQFG